ncbi:MAG: DUF2191 domain-containing protein [Gemmatimonadota bacterium]
MRTTVRLDPALLRAAKRFAAEAGTSLTALIEDGLREVLARQQPARSSPSAELPTFSGDGLRNGVCLDDSAALLDRMDG